MKYDHWGNLVSRRNGLYEQHYAYDAENRLVSARGTGPEGRFEARYHYDALGRRTRKIVTTTHGTTNTRFLWQGYRLLQEQQASGLCSTYVYDPNEAWSPLARVDHLRDQSSGEIYWFNTDLNGAPLEVTDERGAVRWSGQYSSFGEVRHQSEGFSRVVNRTAMAHQPLRYAGQYADGETGLHYNLFRYYDPQVGRFVVQDPIGLNGGWNLYQYAPNPLGWIDPLGLAACNSSAQNRKFWKNEPIEFNGNKVYQRDDLFDPELMTTWREKGKVFRGTNVERMATGRAPAGYDGNAVNLHHMLQTQDGPIAEMSQTFHKTNHGIIHINPNTIPSGIDRSVFDTWRKQYWTNRASDFL